MSIVEIKYESTERQKIFNQNPKRYRLYGGAAGGGKSEAVLYESVALCLEVPNVNGALFRRSYPELEGTLIKRFLDKIDNRLYKYNSTKHIAFFHNGSRLNFCHCKHENDVYAYQSVEYDFVGFDEMTHFTEFQFKYIMSRVRTSKSNYTTRMFGGSNPGNVGHGWVKRLFIDKEYYPEEPYKHTDFDFTHALVQDNKYIMENDPEYIQKLEALPELKKRALLYGDWDVFEGRFFNEWRQHYHTIDEDFTFPPNHELYLSLDYGYSAPSAIYWYCVDEYGIVTGYRESYLTELGYTELAELICLNTPMVERLKINILIADPAIWGDVSRHGASIEGENGAETMMRVFREKGWNLNVIKADNRRIIGWGRMREYLKIVELNLREGAVRTPFLRFTKNCRNAIRTIPQLIFKDGTEDCNSAGEDHSADSIRYFLMSRPRSAKIIVKRDVVEDEFERMNRERLEAIAKDKKKGRYKDFRRMNPGEVYGYQTLINKALISLN